MSCEYCEEVKLKRCQILIEDKIGIRNKTNGKLEFVPNFKEMFVPLDYCPVCRKKVVTKEVKKVWNFVKRVRKENVINQ